MGQAVGEHMAQCPSHAAQRTSMRTMPCDTSRCSSRLHLRRGGKAWPARTAVKLRVRRENVVPQPAQRNSLRASHQSVRQRSPFRATSRRHDIEPGPTCAPFGIGFEILSWEKHFQTHQWGHWQSGSSLTLRVFTMIQLSHARYDRTRS